MCQSRRHLANLDDFARRILDRHPGESRGPEVGPTEAENPLKDGIPAFPGMTKDRLFIRPSSSMISRSFLEISCIFPAPQIHFKGGKPKYHPLRTDLSSRPSDSFGQSGYLRADCKDRRPVHGPDGGLRHGRPSAGERSPLAAGDQPQGRNQRSVARGRSNPPAPAPSKGGNPV